MALKEYIGLARLTQAFSLLKTKLDGKEDTPTVISYDDFMELTPEQQTSGYYLVVGGTPMANAYGISYQPNKTVGDALDDHADAISELNADFAKHSFGSAISLKDYGDNNPYTFPSDGFIRFVCGNNPTGTVARYYVNSKNVFQINVSKLSFADVYTLYVKKGMVFVNATDISPYFLEFCPLT